MATLEAIGIMYYNFYWFTAKQQSGLSMSRNQMQTFRQARGQINKAFQDAAEAYGITILISSGLVYDTVV